MRVQKGQQDALAPGGMVAHAAVDHTVDHVAVMARLAEHPVFHDGPFGGTFFFHIALKDKPPIVLEHPALQKRPFVAPVPQSLADQVVVLFVQGAIQPHQPFGAQKGATIQDHVVGQVLETHDRSRSPKKIVEKDLFK